MTETRRLNPIFLKYFTFLAAFFMMVTVLIGIPGTAQAHAELERSIPEANTRLDGTPEAVELFFNEPIEPKAGTVEVLDAKSNSVTSNDPVVSQDRKSLKLQLPKLGEGVYTVSYQVISADGHPVSGSYVFVIGNPPEGIDASTFDPHKAMGHEGHSSTTQLSTEQFVLYAVRIAYYASLLLAAGFMLWSVLTRSRSTLAEDTLKKWGQLGMRALLVSSLLYVFIHSREILKDYPSSEYSRLFLSTSIGQIWVALILLAIAGFAALRFNRAVKLVWLAAILGVESWSGHAVVFRPKLLSVLFDFIHLAAAAVWVGGLVLVLALWFRDRKEAGRFALGFSKAALLSIAVLALSGVGMTLLFLPSLNYLFYTSWGILLMVKTGFVLLVLVTGGILHMRTRRGDLPTTALLRIDAGLMAAIVVAAALFTYISPVPANEPVYYHKMGEDMHLTLKITPNKPGVNELSVKVWLPENVGEPKSVLLRLHALDRKELGPIDIPIQPFEDKELTSFDGYIKAAYSAEGPFIPFAGRWNAEVRVMDKEDNELVRTYEFRNY
ncbi:copper resistance CopC/CopD family protein [Paenibacillus nasutitermitis]|nr:copper resistance protein CopC [Paenibacillus nasutitermitis]